MAIKRADLHTHTTASDGTEAPAVNVRLAREAGLAAVAITDHDTTFGVAEAIAEGERLNVAVVPGAELSTVADGTDIHILAYYTHPGDSLWLERLHGLRSVRGSRNRLIVERLNSLGIAITMEEVEARAGVRKVGGGRPQNGGGLSSHPSGSSEPPAASGEKTVGRPHIAEVLIAKGVVSTMQEAFDRYLASGAAAYVNPPRVHPLQALEWIREAGGVSVIAHPGLYGKDDLVEQLIAAGAMGIEVYHSDHTEADIARYGRLADRYGLIRTGGSDFHGFREGKPFHGPLGGVTVDAAVVTQLRSAAKR
ncbi:PHP domain-containing protein [Paenibacillus beijingensis]|uniref:Metal-dependent phosphoesterase n=1 Tax=Paenibacillus beijingensis TaxID=1126833 RepID=A0A0D5NN60_9BACL|nr:PHP domain-containing protein [Paenibacillus beijingensis]AJY76447.1 metal-dependent phosphoesterase [Paenibacillus beijingensis]